MADHGRANLLLVVLVHVVKAARVTRSDEVLALATLPNYVTLLGAVTPGSAHANKTAHIRKIGV